MNSPLPKQYAQLAGEMVLRRTIRAFMAHPLVDEIAVVIHPDDEALYRQASEGFELLPFIHGGLQRQDSVRLGLESLSQYAPGQVLIHDAARPFVAASLISRVLEALTVHQAVIPAMALSDTVKQVEDDRITGTLDRNALMLAQTPQGFDFKTILALHQQYAKVSVTDDAALCEIAGMGVYVVPGERANRKLTTDDDMKQAYDLYETRIGSGFDVHRFTEGDHLMLCGIKVPHDRGIEAHSDGDVGLHALVDALLGTIGAGDIGQHFPPSDARWMDADSSDFLRHADELVKERGGSIINIDITIIGEAPKVSPVRQLMVERIAAILELATSRVSIKATTTEKMGFTGRKEGIAAQAVVSVRMPIIEGKIP